MSAAPESSGHSPPAPSSQPGVHEIFATTHWSVVLSAREKDSPKSVEALESLCRSYWYPLYAFLRRSGQSPADAEDLAQGFFARLLEKDYLKAAAREKGRFRTFLLMALKRYMANEWDRQHAKKRGGFAPEVSIDQDSAEEWLTAELAHNVQPDLLFDRQWAVTLLNRAMGRLKEEYVGSGRAVLFEHLQSVLTREESALPYAEIAARLSLTEASIKMAVHRMRSRYRELLRAEIAQTVSSREEVEEEISQLFAAFGS